MILQDRYLIPFDRTYKSVTAAIATEAGKLPSPSSNWLHRLITTFNVERQLWNTRQELEGYRRRWSKLRSNLFRLVAGAYLHIGYDLPRAIADDWPGMGDWVRGPKKMEAQTVYFDLRGIFPASMERSVSDFKAVGWAAIIFRRFSKRTLKNADIWVDNLRRAAWQHAEILALATDRPLKEQKMAEALTAALEDSSDIFWTPLRLLPPDDAVYLPTWTTLFGLLHVLPDLAVLLLLLVGNGSLISVYTQARIRAEASPRFIDVWGSLTVEYLSYAVREPSGFDNFRQTRRAALMLPEVVKSAPA